MTRTTNARVAGFTYLFYIAVAFPAMVLSSRATRGESTPAKLASLVEHAVDFRIAILLNMLSVFSAVVLAVALYGITRDEDRDLARIGLLCRVGEGVVGAAGTVSMTGLLWLATASGPNAPPAEANALAAFLLKWEEGWSTLIAATFFAVGSTFFCYLLLRGRMIPVWLAWLGVIGSAILVVGLPLQLAQFLTGPVTQFMWLPIAVFEIVVAFWLIIKGAAMPAPGLATR
jgi:uncharacterized protein DUF4386